MLGQLSLSLMIAGAFAYTINTVGAILQEIMKSEAELKSTL